jgi:hypothetical protein
MANAIKGEATLEVGERRLLVSFSVDAICQLEERLGQSPKEIGDRIFTDGSVAFKRTLLWGGLRDHHPEFTEKQAGELILELNGDNPYEPLLRAWAACWPIPKAEDANALPDPPRPPTVAARRGTGRGSSPSGASSS